MAWTGFTDNQLRRIKSQPEETRLANQTRDKLPTIEEVLKDLEKKEDWKEEEEYDSTL